MGLPLSAETLEAASRSTMKQCEQCGAHPQTRGDENNEKPRRLFEYGDLRPDAPGGAGFGIAFPAAKAWLLGSRLYSYHRGGVECAAVRLEEPGYTVRGYVVTARDSSSVERLLDEYERRQYPPLLYERDVCEVVTEAGEQVRCYVYHRPEVDQSRPIRGGDWLGRSP